MTPDAVFKMKVRNRSLKLKYGEWIKNQIRMSVKLNIKGYAYEDAMASLEFVLSDVMHVQFCFVIMNAAENTSIIPNVLKELQS
jgi:hypothetical protein